jgi:lysophospholipase L1-like esterase
MKSLLCFGDSLTWGFVAGTWERHKFEDRWPNALGAGLKGAARVIEEGMNGRTTVFPDPTVGEERNGAVGLPIALTTHQPLDLVIIMLGTNDIKYANRCRAFDAAMGMGRLVEIVQRYPWIKTASPPQVLIMSPPALCQTQDEWFNDLWGHAIEESKLFARHYKRVAEEMGVHFFDAGSVAKTDPTDGGHLDAANTRAIGEGLTPVVGKILANRE